MNLNEQISRIRGLIYELAPHSSGVQEFIAQVKEKPELLKHMTFRSMDDLLDYIDNASYEEFSQLRDEVNHFLDVISCVSDCCHILDAHISSSLSEVPIHSLTNSKKN